MRSHERYAEDAPCRICWRPVHLAHDAPCLDCCEVTCPECLPHHCERDAHV